MVSSRATDASADDAGAGDVMRAMAASALEVTQVHECALKIFRCACLYGPQLANGALEFKRYLLFLSWIGTYDFQHIDEYSDSDRDSESGDGSDAPARIDGLEDVEGLQENAATPTADEIQEAYRAWKQEDAEMANLSKSARRRRRTLKKDAIKRSNALASFGKIGGNADEPALLHFPGFRNDQARAPIFAIPGRAKRVRFTFADADALFHECLSKGRDTLAFRDFMVLLVKLAQEFFPADFQSSMLKAVDLMFMQVMQPYVVELAPTDDTELFTPLQSISGVREIIIEHNIPLRRLFVRFATNLSGGSIDLTGVYLPFDGFIGLMNAAQITPQLASHSLVSKVFFDQVNHDTIGASDVTLSFPEFQCAFIKLSFYMYQAPPNSIHLPTVAARLMCVLDRIGNYYPHLFNGRTLAQDLAEMDLGRPRIISLEPCTGNIKGGYYITIKGRNFNRRRAVEVRFDDTVVPAADISSDGLKVAVPPHEPAHFRCDVHLRNETYHAKVTYLRQVTVSVSNDSQTFSRGLAFTYETVGTEFHLHDLQAKLLGIFQNICSQDDYRNDRYMVKDKWWVFTHKHSLSDENDVHFDKHSCLVDGVPVLTFKRFLLAVISTIVTQQLDGGAELEASGSGVYDMLRAAIGLDKSDDHLVRKLEDEQTSFTLHKMRQLDNILQVLGRAAQMRPTNSPWDPMIDRDPEDEEPQAMSPSRRKQEAPRRTTITDLFTPSYPLGVIDNQADLDGMLVQYLKREELEEEHTQYEQWKLKAVASDPAAENTVAEILPSVNAAVVDRKNELFDNEKTGAKKGGVPDHNIRATPPDDDLEEMREDACPEVNKIRTTSAMERTDLQEPLDAAAVSSVKEQFSNTRHRMMGLLMKLQHERINSISRRHHITEAKLKHRIEELQGQLGTKERTVEMLQSAVRSVRGLKGAAELEERLMKDANLSHDKQAELEEQERVKERNQRMEIQDLAAEMADSEIQRYMEQFKGNLQSNDQRFHKMARLLANQTQWIDSHRTVLTNLLNRLRVAEMESKSYRELAEVIQLDLSEALLKLNSQPSRRSTRRTSELRQSISEVKGEAPSKDKTPDQETGDNAEKDKEETAERGDAPAASRTSSRASHASSTKPASGAASDVGGEQGDMTGSDGLPDTKIPEAVSVGGGSEVTQTPRDPVGVDGQESATQRSSQASARDTLPPRQPLKPTVDLKEEANSIVQKKVRLAEQLQTAYEDDKERKRSFTAGMMRRTSAVNKLRDTVYGDDDEKGKKGKKKKTTGKSPADDAEEESALILMKLEFESEKERMAREALEREKEVAKQFEGDISNLNAELEQMRSKMTDTEASEASAAVEIQSLQGRITELETLLGDADTAAQQAQLEMEKMRDQSYLAPPRSRGSDSPHGSIGMSGGMGGGGTLSPRGMRRPSKKFSVTQDVARLVPDDYGSALVYNCTGTTDDTVNKIADKYTTTTDVLMEMNPKLLGHPVDQELPDDTTILVPLRIDALQSLEEFERHRRVIVQHCVMHQITPGDTLNSVADMYRIPDMDSLLRCNFLPDGEDRDCPELLNCIITKKLKIPVKVSELDEDTINDLVEESELRYQADVQRRQEEQERAEAVRREDLRSPPTKNPMIQSIKAKLGLGKSPAATPLESAIDAVMTQMKAGGGDAQGPMELSLDGDPPPELAVETPGAAEPVPVDPSHPALTPGMEPVDPAGILPGDGYDPTAELTPLDGVDPADFTSTYQSGQLESAAAAARADLTPPPSAPGAVEEPQATGSKTTTPLESKPGTGLGSSKPGTAGALDPPSTGRSVPTPLSARSGHERETDEVGEMIVGRLPSVLESPTATATQQQRLSTASVNGIMPMQQSPGHTRASTTASVRRHKELDPIGTSTDVAAGADTDAEAGSQKSDRSSTAPARKSSLRSSLRKLDPQDMGRVKAMWDESQTMKDTLGRMRNFVLEKKMGFATLAVNQQTALNHLLERFAASSASEQQAAVQAALDEQAQEMEARLAEMAQSPQREEAAAQTSAKGTPDGRPRRTPASPHDAATPLGDGDDSASSTFYQFDNRVAVHIPTAVPASATTPALPTSVGTPASTMLELENVPPEMSPDLTRQSSRQQQRRRKPPTPARRGDAEDSMMMASSDNVAAKVPTEDVKGGKVKVPHIGRGMTPGYSEILGSPEDADVEESPRTLPFGQLGGSLGGRSGAERIDGRPKGERRSPPRHEQAAPAEPPTAFMSSTGGDRDRALDAEFMLHMISILGPGAKRQLENLANEYNNGRRRLCTDQSDTRQRLRKAEAAARASIHRLMSSSAAQRGKSRDTRLAVEQQKSAAMQAQYKDTYETNERHMKIQRQKAQHQQIVTQLRTNMDTGKRQVAELLGRQKQMWDKQRGERLALESPRKLPPPAASPNRARRELPSLRPNYRTVSIKDTDRAPEQTHPIKNVYEHTASSLVAMNKKRLLTPDQLLSLNHINTLEVSTLGTQQKHYPDANQRMLQRLAALEVRMTPDRPMRVPWAMEQRSVVQREGELLREFEASRMAAGPACPWGAWSPRSRQPSIMNVVRAGDDTSPPAQHNGLGIMPATLNKTELVLLSTKSRTI